MSVLWKAVRDPKERKINETKGKGKTLSESMAGQGTSVSYDKPDERRGEQDKGTKRHENEKAGEEEEKVATHLGQWRETRDRRQIRSPGSQSLRTIRQTGKGSQESVRTRGDDVHVL